MLKRIDPSEVQMGMYIEKLEGSWLDHPFWRARFVLQDHKKYHKLRTSAVDAVIIDTSKGCDVLDSPDEPDVISDYLRDPREHASSAAVSGKSRSARMPPEPYREKHAEFDLHSVAPQRLAQEFGHATRVFGQARKVVSRAFLDARLGKVVNFATVEPVIDAVYASVQRHPHAFNGLMRCKRESEDVYRSALAVSALMISLGRQLKLGPDQLKQAGLSGLMLNIGVGALETEGEGPLAVAGQGADHCGLSPEQLCAHVQRGYDFIIRSKIDEVVARACLEHHERMDGGGYPARIDGAKISVLGRMAAICDTYDRLVNGSLGTGGIDPAAALQTMSGMAGALDASLMPSMIEAMGVYPVGSLVLLRSRRLALVIDQSADNGARPRVCAFYSVAQNKAIAPTRIDLADCFGEDAIEGVASPETYGIADFPKLREKLFANASQKGS